MVAQVEPLSAVIDLPIDAQAPGLARRAVADTLGVWRVVDDELCYDAALVTSELVGNAVRHGGTRIALSLELADDALVIAVADGTAVLPVQRDGSLEAESGRGLAILTAVTVGWGVEELDDGKRVWAKLAVPPAS